MPHPTAEARATRTVELARIVLDLQSGYAVMPCDIRTRLGIRGHANEILRDLYKVVPAPTIDIEGRWGLTPTEAAIVRYLASQAGRLIPTGELLLNALGYAHLGVGHAGVSTHMTHIRRKGVPMVTGGRSGYAFDARGLSQEATVDA